MTMSNTSDIVLLGNNSRPELNPLPLELKDRNLIYVS